MGLKEQVEADIFGVFLNPDDFGEPHSVNGSRVLCVVDRNNIHMRSPGGRRTEGVREDSQFLYINAKEFVKTPQPNEPLDVDDRKYTIRGVSEEMGMLVIEYGGVAGGQRIPGNRPKPF